MLGLIKSLLPVVLVWAAAPPEWGYGESAPFSAVRDAPRGEEQAVLPAAWLPGAAPLRKTVQTEGNPPQEGALVGNVVADLHEPNDTVSEATPLVAGEKAEGILATASDTDFFVFEAEAGLWALELDGPAEAGLDLALVDGAGEVLQEGGTWLVAPLSVAGPYWVRVSGSGAYRVGVRPLGAPAAVITAGGSIADGLAAALCWGTWARRSRACSGPWRPTRAIWRRCTGSK